MRRGSPSDKMVARAMIRFAWAWALLLAASCASPGLHPAAGNLVQPSPAQRALTAATADVVIPQFGDRRQTVRVGQTIGIAPARPGAQWQVAYSSDHLELLTPQEQLEQPGEAGWVWRAVVAGETEITFTMMPDCPKPPCAPNVMQVTVPLEVVR